MIMLRSFSSPGDSILRIVAKIVLFSLLGGTGCTERGRNAGDSAARTIVFKHGKIEGDRGAFSEILRQFEREHPGITVKDETLPASTDEQHQFYVINLEGRSPDIDVLSMDVIWVPEFARAGWLRDVSGLLRRRSGNRTSSPARWKRSP